MAEAFLALVAWSAVPLLWFLLVGRPEWSVGNRPAAYSVVGVVASLAGGLTVYVPPIYDALTVVTGVPNLGALVGALCMLGAIYGALALLTYWRYEPEQAKARTSRLQLVFGGLAILITGLCLLTPSEHVPPGEWFVVYEDKPTVIFFEIVRGALVGYLSYQTVTWCWPVSFKIRSQPYVRWGLRVLSAAGLVGYVFSAGVAVHVVSVLVDHDMSGEREGLAILRDLVATTWFLGLMLPTLGVVGTAIRRAVRCHQMRPLWLAMNKADITGVIFTEVPRSPWADLFASAAWKDEFLLYRRCVEIRDGYLALRPWFDPDANALATWYAGEEGLKGTAKSVAVEAAAVAWALYAYNHRLAKPQTSAEIGVGAGADMSGEARWLAKVSKAFATSKVVTRTVKEMKRRAEEAKTAARPNSWVRENLERLGFGDSPAAKHAAPSPAYTQTISRTRRPPGS